ncbi:nitroreductase family protein [[Eubacterium] cellulosolvens]
MTEAIKTRRSVRRYNSTSVEESRIVECLEAARWAPSADNSQPWSFIVVRNPETRRKLAQIHDWGKFMAESPVVIAFLADPRRSPRHFHGDAAVAVQNFMLTAHSLGLGTCCMGVIASEFERPIKRLLEVPEDLVLLCTVSVGYPDERPTGSRRPLQEMVHWEKYGARKR